MDSFAAGDADVLVATTIIENGIDIPEAGTILIDDADHFGLSELHQLRGRVGRGDRKAHCYLLVERHKPLKDIARQRLKALEEMNHLGAGFGISIKDLELRGAGNVLGAEQSGHIAAVGYDMYCRLLKQAIDHVHAGEDVEQATFAREEEREAGTELELGLKAYLPEEWIPTEDVRIAVLRQLTALHEEEELDALEPELRDRFGRLPEEASALLRQFRLKLRLDPYRLSRVSLREEAYLIEYGDPVAMESFVQPLEARGAEVRRIRRGVVYLVIPPRQRAPADALDWLEGLLSVAHPPSTMAAEVFH
jgi:transcription-repair coupling factor (superfamily II helicase)